MVIAAGLVILAVSGYLSPLTKVVFSPVIGAQTWLSERFLAVQNILSTPTRSHRINAAKCRIEAEVSSLETQIIEFQQQLTEFQILSSLLDFARAYPEYEYVGASVIGRDPARFCNM